MFAFPFGFLSRFWGDEKETILTECHALAKIRKEHHHKLSSNMLENLFFSRADTDKEFHSHLHFFDFDQIQRPEICNAW